VSFRHFFVRSCAAPFGSISPSGEQGGPHHRQDLTRLTRLSRPRLLLVTTLAPNSEAAHAAERALRRRPERRQGKNAVPSTGRGSGRPPSRLSRGYGHGHRQGALRGQRSNRRETASLNATLPRRGAPACV